MTKHFITVIKTSHLRSHVLRLHICAPPRCFRSLSSSSTESSIIRTASTNVSQGWWDKFKDQLLRTWDEHSGQRELDQLKRSVQQASLNFDATVATVASCRSVVEEAQKAHDESQKQHANLMMRRDQWDGTDAASFVEYTSREVKTRHALAEARNELRKAEEESSRCQREYMDVMRQRYHEEQMWQDKWRMLGTFGTWTLIGLNSLVFLGSQFFHQRREVNRLKAIEELIKENLQVMQDTVSSSQAEQIAIAEAAAASKPTSAMNEPEKEKAAIEIAQETVTPKPVKEPTDWLKLIKSNDYKTVTIQLGASAQEIAKELHAPSVALGAASSAVAFVIVVLFTQKR
ncbi:She9 / Mdm33 family [Fragilaria crotonensis]|nr:She9 / Mdm33 family [Fragilaria crotonensis]